MADSENLADAVAALIVGMLPAREQPGGPGAYTVLPPDYSVHDLEHLQPAPNRIRQSITLTEVQDFVTYCNRFATKDTMGFHNWRNRSASAALDYHAPGAPSHCSHRANFKARRDNRWDRWRAKDGDSMSQSAFARFLEVRAHEIVEPDAATVIETCLNLQRVKKVSWRSSVHLPSGLRQLAFVEEDETRGEVRVPETFKIEVPIFEGTEPSILMARLRTHISDGGILSMCYEFDDVDEIERQAFELLLVEIRAGVKFPMLATGAGVGD